MKIVTPKSMFTHQTNKFDWLVKDFILQLY